MTDQPPLHVEGPDGAEVAVTPATPPPDIDPRPLEDVVGVEALDAVETVGIPWGFDDFTCPACERIVPTRKQIRLAIPARFEHLLNQCFKCPYCNFIWSPKRLEAKVLARR